MPSGHIFATITFIPHQLAACSLIMHDLAQLEPFSKDVPPTKRGHERCLALLLSANDLFLEHGYDAVSLDDIVHHAGGSKAFIYKYFGNKEGLFTAICDYRAEKFFKDICLPFESFEGDLRAYLIHTLDNFKSHLSVPANSAFLRLILERTQHNVELARYIYEQGPKHLQTSIAHALDHAAAQGLFRCENSLYSAQLFFGILRNLEWRILMGLPVQDDPQTTDDYIHYCVDHFLQGHQIV